MGYDGLKADIWSLGVILYNMLSKELPFDDESIPKLIDKIVLVQYTFPKHFSKEVKDFISKILISNPSKRMTLEEMKMHDWLGHAFTPKLSEEASVERKLSLSKFNPQK
jgi:serine/threonine protein kinase